MTHGIAMTSEFHAQLIGFTGLDEALKGSISSRKIVKS